MKDAAYMKQRTTKGNATNPHRKTRHLILGVFGCCLLGAICVGCSGEPMKDFSGRTLPAVGAEARLIEKHGWVATSEQAMRDLTKPPSIPPNTPKAVMLQSIDRALVENAKRLIEAGTLLQVTPGVKVRIAGYLNADLKPLYKNDHTPECAKVEILEGPAKGKIGYTVADGVE